MGALVSLPLSTMLALPLLSSYTTSLNLLFFTLNWYILLLSHPPLMVEIYGIVIVRLFCFLLPALAFLAFDTGLPSVAIQIKAQGRLGLPGRISRDRLVKIVGTSIFNSALGVGLLVGAELLVTKGLGRQSLLNIGKRLPLPWSAIQTILFGLGVRGTLQYAIHRYVLHAPNNQIASLHRRWQHSIASPFSIVAAYDHPIAYVLHHWIPLYLPAIIFRTHLLPFLAICSIASIEDLMVYSGYSVLPSAILVKGMARRVDNHFIVRGKGNFAAFGLIDWFTGTSVGNDVVDDLKAEWDKHDMDEKVQHGADEAGDLMETVGNKIRNATSRRTGRKTTT